MEVAELLLIISEQDTIGSEIDRIWTNYRKDSITRKTQDYLQKKLTQLEELWTKFAANDAKIKMFSDQYPDELYFKNQYFQQGEIIYNKFKTNIEQLMSQIPQLGHDEPKDVIQENLPKELSGQSASSNENEATKEDLVTKRIKIQKILMQTITYFLEKIETSLTSPQPKAFYEVKINLLNHHAQELRRNNQEIWEISSEEEPDGYTKEYYFELEEWIQDTLIKLQEHLNRMSPRYSNEPITYNNSLKLPKLVIPKFDGNYLTWINFRDLYTQLVHEKPMSNIEKMYYLMNNITGEPFNLVKHLPNSNENYHTAWQIICDRYENKRFLVSALLNKFSNQQTIHTESATALKSLHDTTKEVVLGLKNVGISVETWDPMLVHLLLKKFDKNTMMLYEQSLMSPKELTPLKVVLTFLEKRFQALETVSGRTPFNKFNQSQRPSSALTAMTSHNSSCVTCKANHPLFACNSFLSKTPVERLKTLTKYKLCINCMRGGHTANTCTMRPCTKCSKKHNTLVHTDYSTRNNKTLPEKSKSTTSDTSTTKDRQTFTAQENQSKPVSLAVQPSSTQQKYVLLGTAKVIIVAPNGNQVLCKAILDSGSQLNLITKRLVKKLEIAEVHDPLNIFGIGHGKLHTQDKANILIKSRTTGYSSRIEARILPEITKYHPDKTLNISGWNIPGNIELADPEFFRPYFELLSVGQIKLSDELPVLQNTVLGWVIGGTLQSSQKTPASLCSICTHDEESQLAPLLHKFWNIENPETTSLKLSPQEKKCENFFTSTTKRDQTGRFVVRLPFAIEGSNLGESRNSAVSRLFTMEKKLRNNPEMKEQYNAFLKEYEELGHMSEVDIRNISMPCYFLPHHCVLKPESATTKLRVVFDGSSKTTTNQSLNDVLHTGPKIQADLFSILLRFRLHRYVFTADIEKMYRQILVHPDDRRFQIIAWRSNEKSPIRYYQLNTVTYGLTSSPYLAIKCLHHLATQEAYAFPIGAEAIKNELYVDDAMVGADTLQEAMEKQYQLNELLKSAGFRLRKWSSNHNKLLEHIPVEDRVAELELHYDKEYHISTLGVKWTPASDEFHITRAELRERNKVTKREVLSDIAHLFDPLGILGPVIITAKIYLQRLWQLKLDWDQAVPQHMYTEWIQYRKAMQELHTIRIPRHIASGKMIKSKQLHVFCDASEKAYGCVIYVRSTLQDGTVIVRLLCAKSRVAPTKTITLPRLELCAAQLGAQLLDRIKMDLQWKDPCFCWTDSEIVLAWIKAMSSSYHTFVANRISTIQEITCSEQWNHIAGKDTPADLISRGMTPEKLKNSALWFYGPLFLHGPQSTWPIQTKIWNTEMEMRKPTVVLKAVSTTTCIIDDIDHRNSLVFLQRVLSYVQRFAKACRKQERASSIHLQVPELEEALVIIIKAAQNQEFAEDLETLKRTRQVRASSSILSLSPFLDINGIIRVGGRLQESGLSYDTKHPMLLPYAHKITQLIFDHYHKTNSHAGPQALLAFVRQRFWPIKGKTMARTTVKRCVPCCKSKPQLLQPSMGNLPAHRVQQARPFMNAGVDFCGPFWTHFKIRGKKPVKSYVAIFCCFATKAVHIEVVTDLTTEAFIGALKRFISRRGHCKHLYCDNATNFVGANNQLSELRGAIYSEQAEEKLTKFCATKAIEFHFIPPRAPHFGGLWEAAVKSAKTLFYKNVTAASLTYEELETIMLEIEAILNSRPLTPMSSDPNDSAALTPGHFLIGEPLNTIADSQATTVKGNLHHRWKVISELKKQFWQRWTNEYLSELQQRHKWNKPVANIEIGTLVIIKEDNTPVCSWPLGRIIQTFKGNDGYIRVADVKTATGVIRRAITRLAPLLINEATVKENDSNANEEKTVNHLSKQHSDKRSNPTMDSQSPSQRKRIKLPSLSTLFLTCLVLPMFTRAETTITPFDTPPGLYFENHGNTYFTANDWTIVAFFDLSTYRTELESIHNLTQRLSHVCTLMTDQNNCNSTLAQINSNIVELHSSNDLLVPHTRPKRAPLDIVGNVARSLFGVLDSEYAENMEDIIDDLNKRQDHVRSLLKNQTSIIDSTTNIMKNLQATTEQKLQNFHVQLDETVQTINSFLREQRTIEAFNRLALQLVLSITNYQRIQTALIDVVIDTHHGNISPLLLTPRQLQMQLNTIKDNIPPTLHLSMLRNNLQHLYNLMKVDFRVTTNKIIFRLRLPLLAPEIFQLLNAVPVPVEVNGTFITIQPSSEYLLVNLHRDTYYPLSQQEFTKCNVIENSIYICEQQHPLFRRTKETDNCEVTILLQLSLPTSCPFITSKDVRRWTKLHAPNQWIYVVNQTTEVNIICEDKISRKTLKGTGLLELAKGCQLKDEVSTLQGHSSYETTINTAIIPTQDAREIIQPDQIKVASQHQMSPRILADDISQLKASIKSLQQQEQMPEFRRHQIHHFSISYISLSLILIFGIGLLWKCLQNNTQPKLPQVVPDPNSGKFRFNSSVDLNKEIVQGPGGC